ncbi:MAG TPA: malto-oligosyltrehalose trehalohydrolase [Terriglobales bacterium]|nr:malto-oligosyltrehalose trehalohydrolase [Terriglobales bacterium]
MREAGGPMKLGATTLPEGRCRFVVWAPAARRVELHLVPDGKQPEKRLVPMESTGAGYWHLELGSGVLGPGSRYMYRLEGGLDRPDPASRFQPEGVHGPSQVAETGFAWSDLDWKGHALEEYVLYEAHVGTFTSAGTFDAMVPRLDALRDLGITALELMPVAQFPGERNWGYDGAYPFAAQNSYGGPEGLRRLVDACHTRKMAVVLDVVYNHLGPEGNYLADFGPYFTDRYRTPWGPAINFDGPGSDEVRRFFIENALYWIEECHVDALRLDAVHAIVDPSARPFLEELGKRVHECGRQLGRQVYLMAESDRNDPRLVEARERNGLGLDALWNDDFHHSLHALLTGERKGYYCDFGRTEQMAAAFRQGFVYTGQYSEYRRRRHGSSSAHVPARRMVVFTQNHDQVGNRMLGERLSSLVSLDALKLAAGLVLLSPYLPLLFMGEEYGEPAPFQYFVSHSDTRLIEAVRNGRREEFAAFGWQGGVPDPQDPATFERSRLRWELRDAGHHAALAELYRELLGLRRSLPALACGSKEEMEVHVHEAEHTLAVRRWHGKSEALAVFHFADAAGTVKAGFPGGEWVRVLDSSDARWMGPGSRIPERVSGDVVLPIGPKAFVLFARV